MRTDSHLPAHLPAPPPPVSPGLGAKQTLPSRPTKRPSIPALPLPWTEPSPLPMRPQGLLLGIGGEGLPVADAERRPVPARPAHSAFGPQVREYDRHRVQLTQGRRPGQRPKPRPGEGPAPREVQRLRGDHGCAEGRRQTDLGGKGGPGGSPDPVLAASPLHRTHPASPLCALLCRPPAPELLEGQSAVPQTDIWAIGVTAFIM